MFLGLRNRPAWCVLIAIGAVALAAVLRQALHGALGGRVLYITFYPAVIFSAVLGGLPAGLLATFLSVATAAYFFLEPFGSWIIDAKADRLGLGVFFMCSVVISWAVDAMQRAQLRASKAEADAKLVTERQRADEESHHYRLLADNTRDIILYMHFEDGRLLDANAAAIRAYGYTRDELLALTIHDLRAPETRAAATAQLAEAASHGIQFETIHRRKDGSLFPAEVSSQGAEIGGKQALVSVVRDITLRKRAEDALVEQREWLRVTLTSIGDAVLATDVAGRVTFLNPVASALTGWTEPEALGLPVQEVFRILNEQTRQPAEDVVSRVLERKHAVALANHTVLVARGGSEVPIEDSAAPIRDAKGSLTGVVVVFHDVTEKRRAQQAAEQRMLAMQSAGMGAWDYRFQTGEVFWDERCCALSGFPEGERVAYAESLERIHPEDRAGIDEALQRAIAGHNDGIYHREFRVVWPDGSTHWLSSHGKVYFTGEGDKRRPERFLGVMMDITKRRSAEEALRLSQKLESVGVLAGGIAHDFNNLLVGVIGNASLAEEMLPAGSPLASTMRGIVTAGERAAELTRQLLAYAGRGRFVFEPVNLSDLVRNAGPLLQSSIPKRIPIELKLASGLPPIDADPGQMRQILINLAVNAGEAIGPHPGSITISTGMVGLDAAFIRSELTGWAIEPGQCVSLEVRDTGCGMDAATQAKIFDPFFSTKFTGRGLGLAAAAGIVRGHGGAIKVESTPGQGSTFRVLFPVSQAGPVAQRAPERAVERHGSGTVLIIDDEEVVRDTAAKALARQGFHALAAASGRAGIELLAGHTGEIDLVVLDLSMPGMGGEDVLPELRKLAPEVRILVSSGFSETETMSLFASQTVSGFIQKPYTPSALAEKVAAALQ